MERNVSGEKTENKWKNIWKISEKYLSLQRQNVCFDYAAECGEQALIDTTPFKSHLTRAAFLFLIKLSEDAVEIWITSQPTFDRDRLVSLKYQYLLK